MFLIFSQLISQILIGADFLYNYQFSVDFNENCMIEKIGGQGEMIIYKFLTWLAHLWKMNPHRG
jgi:hypothetical protein